MNNPNAFFTIFLKPKNQILTSVRNIYKVSVLNQRALRKEGAYTKEFDNDLFYTNLPKITKREKKPKIPSGPLPAGNLVIKCKNPELNHYSGMTHGKFDAIPLASRGWHHNKSKGDHFTILPYSTHPAFIAKEELPDTFEEIGISDEVIQQLHKINVTHPTVIQAKVSKHLLKGSNVFITAECGSGKTLGYLIALIENVLKWKAQVSNNYNAPFGVILLPTRELAIQVGLLADKLSRDLGIKCQALIGGDIDNLLLKPEMAPVDILTCTLKVFIRHLKANLYKMNHCKHVIVDEADSLIEKSFIGQLKKFMFLSGLEFTGLAGHNVTNKSAQICFVSASVPKDMEEQLFFLIKGNNMTVETTSFLHRTISFATQEFRRVLKCEKSEALLKIVKYNFNQKIPTMIFSNKRSTANWVAEFLKENGIECGKITRKLYADERLPQFRDFEAGDTRVISCTDLGSRGLNFTKVKHVINYEFPSFMIDYIHRCGRTGRIDQGENCIVTNFISGKHELGLLKKIEIAVRTNSSLPSIYQNRIKHYKHFKN